MNLKPIAFLVMSGMFGGATFAQQPQSSNAATPAANAAPTAATAPPANTPATSPADNKAAGPSPDVLKKAKNAGYRTKVKAGQTLFCKTEAEIGSHFTEEKCIGETQMLMVLDREQQQRDGMTNHTCSSGGACSGK